MPLAHPPVEASAKSCPCFRKCGSKRLSPLPPNQASPGTPSAVGPSTDDASPCPHRSSCPKKPLVPELGRSRAPKRGTGTTSPTPLPTAVRICPITPLAPLPGLTAPTSQGTFSSGTGKRRV